MTSTESELLARRAAQLEQQKDLGRALLANINLQVMRVKEEGADPIEIALRGSCMPMIGAQFPVESRGGKYVPMFSKRGYSVVSGLLFGDTEMSLSWEIPFFYLPDCIVTGTERPETPEALFKVFQKIQERGRNCQFSLGEFSRSGVLRLATPGPGRGYLVKAGGGPNNVGATATNEIATPGTNLEVSLRWEWNGEGLPAVPSDIIPTVENIRGQLSNAQTAFEEALSDEDPFAPSFLEKMNAFATQMGSSVSSLRKALAQVGSLATAPAGVANNLISVGRKLGDLANDADRLLSDVPNAYVAVNDSANALLRTRRAKGKAKQALTVTMTSIVDMLKALEGRKPRLVGVHPGELLTEVAAKQLGSADRWKEIADLNGISGKKVPPGTFQVQVKG